MTTTPLSLYLDLEEGEVADMEVVARAAIAFSAAIKELAYILEPGIEVRVELLSGTEGSLSLNSFIKGIGSKVTKDRLITIAWGIAAYFALETRDYTVGRFLDWITGTEGKEAAKHLSQDDIDRIATALEARVAQPQIRQVYKEIERDPAIKGVGASTVLGERPRVIVPRAEFQQRAGMAVVVTETKRRTVPDRMTVVLVSPMLQEGTRRWRFKGPTGEFGAPLRDADFTARVLSGTTPIPMVAGIIMDIEVETDEELRDGVWVVVERRVTHVFGIKPPAAGQAPLPLSPRDDNGGDDDD